MTKNPRESTALWGFVVWPFGHFYPFAYIHYSICKTWFQVYSEKNFLFVTILLTTNGLTNIVTRVFDTLFAPWFSQSPTLQPFEAYFFVKFLFFLCTLLYSCNIIDIYIYIYNLSESWVIIFSTAENEHWKVNIIWNK